MFFLIGLVGVVFSFLTSTIMLRKAVEIDLVDRPNIRSSHTGDIPKGGGLVFAGLFTLYCLVLYFASPGFKNYVTPLLISGPALFGLGWLDDRLRLSATIRLLVHVLVGVFVLYSLTQGFKETFSVLFIPNIYWVTLGFCLLYIAWFVNLYNFMDGADGIAGGVGLISALALSIIAHQGGSLEISRLYFFLACALSGFVYFNWNPARFFMGDSGAYFLGITFSVLSLVAVVEDNLSLYPTVIVLGLFIVDATYTLLARLARGENPYTPHQQFGFHKLFKRGWSHGEAARLYLGIVSFWLVPMAVLAASIPDYALWVLVASYLPLIGFEVYIKAGKG